MSTVLITGASRGIGLACARRLILEGHRVSLLARPSTHLEAVSAELGAFAVGCDLADADAIAPAFLAVERALGGEVEVLVNNAGIVHRHPVDGHAPEAWDRVMAVNLRAPFLLSRLALPAMLRRGAGRIINVASISATHASPGLAAYCASKAGLLGFTRAMSAEVKGRGVTVVAVSPGSVDTDMLVGSGFEPDMSADDVARVVAFLVSAPPALAGASIEVFG